jgi:hypothetical protein
MDRVSRRKCPGCGRKNQGDPLYCYYCGRALRRKWLFSLTLREVVVLLAVALVLIFFFGRLGPRYWEGASDAAKSTRPADSAPARLVR